MKTSKAKEKKIIFRQIKFVHKISVYNIWMRKTEADK